MAEKKNMLSYQGLKELEDELQDLRLRKQGSRAICLRMPSMMQLRMSRET